MQSCHTHAELLSYTCRAAATHTQSCCQTHAELDCFLCRTLAELLPYTCRAAAIHMQSWTVEDLTQVIPKLGLDVAEQVCPRLMCLRGLTHALLPVPLQEQDGVSLTPFCLFLQEMGSHSHPSACSCKGWGLTHTLLPVPARERDGAHALRPDTKAMLSCWLGSSVGRLVAASMPYRHLGGRWPHCTGLGAVCVLAGPYASSRPLLRVLLFTQLAGYVWVWSSAIHPPTGCVLSSAIHPHACRLAEPAAHEGVADVSDPVFVALLMCQVQCLSRCSRTGWTAMDGRPDGQDWT